MINNLRSRFEESGYQTIEVNVNGLSLLNTVVNESVYIICIMDYSSGQEFSQEQYSNIRRQIKQNFINRGYLSVELLGIILTKYPERAKVFCQDEDSQWIVDETLGRLIIYENQPGHFLDARELVEETLCAPQTLYTDVSGVTFSERIPKVSLFNSIVIAVNIIIFLSIEITGSSENADYMVKWGAMYWPMVMEQGQYYRLVTHIFLHFGIQHLLNNMLVLAVIGDNLERLVGKGKFLFLYLGTGILAGLASMVYNIQQDTVVVSAGASGAIFGVVGAMIYIVAVNRGRVENISTRQLAIFAILSLYSGFASQGVDNAAHIGGLTAGVVLAMLCYRKPKRKDITDQIFS